MFRRIATTSPNLRPLFIAATVASIFTCKTAAAGGYFLGPIGGQAVGRAGAFVAKANDLSAAYYNPAGFALVKGTRLQLDNKFSYNTYEFQREPVLDGSGVLQTFASVSNEPKFQPLDPLLGVATDFGLSDFAFALVAYANSGVSKMEFPVDGGQRYMMTKRDGIFINYSLNAAWRPHPKFAIGVSPQVVAVPELTYQLVVNGNTTSGLDAGPVSNTYDLLATVKGKDLFTFNTIVGAWYEPVPSIQVGFSAQVLPSKVKTRGPIRTEFLNPNLTLPDPETTRNGTPADDVSIELPLPMWAKLGARFVDKDNQGRERFDIELDVTYERWSTVDKFVVDSFVGGHDLLATSRGNQIPIGTINVDKQWQDVLGFALGGDYAALPDALTLRAGAYYETAVAEPEYTNVDFVTGQQIGGTLGATVFVGGLSVSLGYEYRFQPDVVTTAAAGQVVQVVPALQDEPNQRVVVNGGTYRADSHSAVLGLAYTF